MPGVLWGSDAKIYIVCTLIQSVMYVKTCITKGGREQ